MTSIMISSRRLIRCIDLLAQINATGDIRTRQMALEVGYVLKQELDVVTSVEQAQAVNQANAMARLSPDTLLKDNIQLFQENQKLLKANMELKDMLEKKVDQLSAKMDSVNRNVSTIAALARMG
jgi:hypothetical protein